MDVQTPGRSCGVAWVGGESCGLGCACGVAETTSEAGCGCGCGGVLQRRRVECMVAVVVAVLEAGRRSGMLPKTDTRSPLSHGQHQLECDPGGPAWCLGGTYSLTNGVFSAPVRPGHVTCSCLVRLRRAVDAIVVVGLSALDAAWASRPAPSLQHSTVQLERTEPNRTESTQRPCRCASPPSARRFDTLPVHTSTAAHTAHHGHARRSSPMRAQAIRPAPLCLLNGPPS